MTLRSLKKPDLGIWLAAITLIAHLRDIKGEQLSFIQANVPTTSSLAYSFILLVYEIYQNLTFRVRECGSTHFFLIFKGTRIHC